MAWSTRQLAELAGTTVNTIRHYHRLGLLPEPERQYNGYKQYTVPDLVRLLRIRRLVDLGVPLAEIGEVSTGGESAPETLRALDAELAAHIARLQKARDDIAAILSGQAPADAPAGFEAVSKGLSEADSSIIHIYTKLYDEDALADVRSMIEADTTEPELSREIDDLPPDADEATRQSLAERLAPSMARDLAAYPWLQDPVGRFAKSELVTYSTVVEALVALYNPAQLDVYGRAAIIAGEGRRPGSKADPGAASGAVSPEADTTA